MQLNYRVRPQWQVGHYRIDLVVEGGGRRLAIECDGDRWHPPDKLGEDLERQAILERLGWTFVRVRGTEFFRDPERSLDPVLEMLERLGIPAEARGEDVLGPQSGITGELLERVLRRAEELRREWSKGAANGDREETQEGEEIDPQDIASGILSPTEARVLEAIRGASRPLGKSEILARARIDGATWWSTIGRLRRRGLIMQEGNRRGATYRLAKSD
jgi:very-short-patch-repair endonuclease